MLITILRVDTVRVRETTLRVDTVHVVVSDTVFRTIRVPGPRMLFVPPGHYPPEDSVAYGFPSCRREDRRTRPRAMRWGIFRRVRSCCLAAMPGISITTGSPKRRRSRAVCRRRSSRETKEQKVTILLRELPPAAAGGSRHAVSTIN